MNKLGKQTIKFDSPPTITEVASIVGPKESQGPLAKYFDKCLDDEFWGEKTWEKAESKIIKETVNMAIAKSNIPSSDIDFCFAGDLLNQCISSSFGLREINIPFFGVFGACSTFVESMCLGSVFIDGGSAKNVLCSTSSHFCSAEKQFRFPLELGNQRPPTSQWTVTGSGAAVLSKDGNGPFITHITPGKIVDMGIKDANEKEVYEGSVLELRITDELMDPNKNLFYNLNMACLFRFHNIACPIILHDPCFFILCICRNTHIITPCFRYTFTSLRQKDCTRRCSKFNVSMSQFFIFIIPQ